MNAEQVAQAKTATVTYELLSNCFSRFNIVPELGTEAALTTMGLYPSRISSKGGALRSALLGENAKNYIRFFSSKGWIVGGSIDAEGFLKCFEGAGTPECALFISEASKTTKESARATKIGSSMEGVQIDTLFSTLQTVYSRSQAVENSLYEDTMEEIRLAMRTEEDRHKKELAKMVIEFGPVAQYEAPPGIEVARETWKMCLADESAPPGKKEDTLANREAAVTKYGTDFLARHRVAYCLIPANREFLVKMGQKLATEYTEKMNPTRARKLRRLFGPDATIAPTGAVGATLAPAQGQAPGNQTVQQGAGAAGGGGIDIDDDEDQSNPGGVATGVSNAGGGGSAGGKSTKASSSSSSSSTTSKGGRGRGRR